MIWLTSPIPGIHQSDHYRPMGQWYRYKGLVLSAALKVQATVTELEGGELFVNLSCPLFFGLDDKI